MPLPWPNGYKACICVTFDNMGEAADLHRGLWPADQATGHHYAVTESLPRMMDLIDRLALPLTYYIEGWNCKIYSETMKDLQARNIEVGFHAYQHEVWSTLDEQIEQQNLDKSVADAISIGIGYKGFRPPGGKITPLTLGLMKQKGIFYLSPAAETVAAVEDVAILPFQWRIVDAYFYLPSTAPLRQIHGDSSDTLSADVSQQRTIAAINDTVRNGGFLSLLFHPFLTDTTERLSAMRNILEHLSSLREDVWLCKMHEAAEVVLKHKESFPDDPGWDTADWKKKVIAACDELGAVAAVEAGKLCCGHKVARTRSFCYVTGFSCLSNCRLIVCPRNSQAALQTRPISIYCHNIR